MVRNINSSYKQGKVDIMTLLVFICLFFVLVVYHNFWSKIDCWLQDFWQNARLNINKAQDNQVVDLLKLKKIFPAKTMNKDIVLIIVDDDSLISLNGLLAQDQGIYAKALENLKNLNPKVVGVDVYFHSKDERKTGKRNEKNRPITYGDTLVDAVKAFGDKIVLKSYRRKVIIPENERENDGKKYVAYVTNPPFSDLLELAAPAPSLFENNLDETIRLVSLQFKDADGKIPSFQELLWAKFLDKKIPDDIKIDNNYLTLNNENLVKLINSSYSNYLLLNYDRPFERIRKFRFIDLYNNIIPKHEIENKLVIIGWGNSMTQEKYYTPIKGIQYPPVLNGLVLSNLLENSYLTPNNLILTIILILITLLILFFVFSYASPETSLVVTLIVVVIYLNVSLFGLLKYNMQIDVIAPIMGATLSFIFMIGRRYYLEYSEKKHIKSAFQHYVTASVVNEILKDPTKLNLHGEERNLTIFFSDIEGFTTLAEGMSPLDVVSLLNEYLTAMTDIIFEYNGLLDKYEGDAIMAVFGAPVDQSDHAIRACQCALKNQKVLNQLRDKWHAEGKPEMRVRIGINTGVVVVGNMGSTMRFDYTVIGDNVNLAARLEAANKIFNSSILVSEETAKLAEKKVVSRKIARFKAIGKSVYTNIYELLADKDTNTASEIEIAYKAKEAYEAADACIMNRDFEGAEKVLGLYLRDFKDDQPAKILYNKIKGFLLVPPPADWENIVRQEEK